jgi:hypothetical protein
MPDDTTTPVDRADVIAGLAALLAEIIRNAPTETLTAVITGAERHCHTHGLSFPDMLRDALTDAARHLGGTEQLVRTRPGSWEADHIRALTGFADVAPEPDGFTCPRCGRTSHNPNDRAQGYCGACHDWTARS